MNVRRFVGKNAREAMAQVRALWGDQAAVLANRPVPGGVEILAMAGAEVPAPPARTAAAEPAAPMSTLSFQEFVRERQRLDAQKAAAEAAPETPVSLPAPAPRRPPTEPGRFAAQQLREELAREEDEDLPLPRPVPPVPAVAARAFAAVERAGDGDELISELKSVRGMIASQLATMNWFDGVRRNPAQTRLLRLLLGNGFSATLARQLVHRLPADREAQAEPWLLALLARNLRCTAPEDSIAERGGVYALVGPTGVGKTTTTAKMASHFAMKHGAGSVGLITVDTYRMAASDQLRAFGRILNIPVHTARDAASLADLLDLFVNKKLVLIDTVGVGQRDRRLAELFAALPAHRVQRLLVLNAGAQGEALEEVVQAYGAGPGTRCAVSKLDEAVKCGAVADVAIRHRLVIEGLANGQRVPEDWHPARAQLLAQKALMREPSSLFTPDDTELGLLLTAPPDAAASNQERRVQRA
jgi:flagellar biosynthesis protein FlhF